MFHLFNRESGFGPKLSSPHRYRRGNLFDSQGLVPPEKFSKAQRPVKLIAVNEQTLEGEEKEAHINLAISALDQKSGRQLHLRIPTWFYEADIHEDIILSYEWCHFLGGNTSPRKHGIFCFKAVQKIWIDGAQAAKLTHPEALVQIIEDVKGFCAEKDCIGSISETGRVAKVLEEWGDEVVTVNFKTKWNTKVFCVHNGMGL